MSEHDKSEQLFDSALKPKGLTRIVLAAKNSSRALTWLFKNESAFRQECLLLAAVIPISYLFDLSAMQQLALVCSVIFVLLVEIVNTAIEVIVDRIGLELHPLSGLAKDLGSAAVALSLLIMAMIWLIVLL